MFEPTNAGPLIVVHVAGPAMAECANVRHSARHSKPNRCSNIIVSATPGAQTDVVGKAIQAKAGTRAEALGDANT